MALNDQNKNIYFKEKEIKNVGPSIDSDDIQQRIAARRIKLQNRLERLRGDVHSNETKSSKEDIGLGRSQIELSSKRISKLVRDGDAFITNIRVACDAREYFKRTEDHELNHNRIRVLEDEATRSLEAFNKITEQWEKAQESELLDETKEMLDKQNTLCKDLIAEKNKLINELNLEIKAKDDHYNAFLDQREKLTSGQSDEWGTLMNEIKQKQINYLKQREDQAIEYEKEFYDLRTKYSEEYNALKISLGSEVETLESHLQKLKSTYQLNTEKLDYNYQVLKRRDEENTMLKSNQKRRITRLQDTLNNLSIKSTKQEQQYKVENEQLSEDYKRRMENYSDLQKKSKLLIESIQRNFHDIWIMNEENLKKLANRLLDAHRIITEQQLGLTWNPPDISFMENVGPVKQITSKPPVIIAMELALQSDKKKFPDSQNVTSENTIPTTLKEVSSKIVQEFLHLLCYEPEFLIDENMKRLLEPLGYEEGLLLRLDTILTVLGVQTEEDLNILFTYFIEQQKDNQSQFERISSTTTEESNESVQKSPPKYVSLQSLQESSDIMNETLKIVQDESNEVQSTATGKCSVKTDESPICHKTEKSLLKWNLISPVHVIDVIYQFTEDMRKRELSNDQNTINDNDNTNNNISNKINKFDDYRIRDDSKDLIYWDKYKQNIVTEEWEEIWNNLYIALEKYYNILKHRAKLIHDTDGLRKQNAELRHLLQQYMNSKVNYELQIPPSKIMSFI
uniref:NYD-SP28_assoc domain-containing protein n=1 Tax=Schistosoma mansoni TaxID=6183 RepID=A0A5K4FEY6_SCHMA